LSDPESRLRQRRLKSVWSNSWSAGRRQRSPWARLVRPQVAGPGPRAAAQAKAFRTDWQAPSYPRLCCSVSKVVRR